MSNRENAKPLDWDGYYDRNPPRDFDYLSSEQLDRLVSETAIASGKVIDLGCGTGQLDEQLLARGFDVVGVDGASQALEKAKQRNPGVRYMPPLNLEESFPEELQDQLFDMAICKFVLAFIGDKAEFMNQIKRLLDEQGVLVIISTTLDQVSMRQQNIAVDFDETMELLKTVFNKVEHYEDSGVTVFVARN